MMKMPHATFTVGGAAVEVWRVQGGRAPPRDTLAYVQALALVRQLLRTRVVGDTLVRLCLGKLPMPNARGLQALQQEAAVLQLLRAGLLAVRLAPPCAVAPENIRAAPHVARSARTAHAPGRALWDTVLRLRRGLDAGYLVDHTVALSSAAQVGPAAVSVRPDSMHFYEVPEALDDGRAQWQLTGLLEAAHQGTLETWGVPGGEGSRPTGAG